MSDTLIPSVRSFAGQARRPVIALGSGVVMLACLFTLLAGYSIKAPCPVMEMRSWCYSDIQALWDQRDLVSHSLPYLHGGVAHATVDQQMANGEPGLLVLTGHELEYPVLTGLFVWATSLLAHDVQIFFYVNALALTGLVLFTLRLLMKMAGRRVLLFALAPTLAWYAYLNWDVLVVSSTVAAIYAWWRHRYWLCGALLGVGICLKAWPAFLLIPLAFDLILRRPRRDLAGALVAAGGVTALLNLPFMLHNWEAWKAPYTFQSSRPMTLDTNSLWPYLWSKANNVVVANHLSELACALAFGIILAEAWRVSRFSGIYPFVQTSAAMIAVFVALGRVHSPQYAIWILPFFVLLRIRFRWWVAFVLTDAWLFAQWTIVPLWVQVPLLRSAVLLSDIVLCVLAFVAMRAPLAFHLEGQPPLTSSSLRSEAGPAEPVVDFADATP